MELAQVAAAPAGNVAPAAPAVASVAQVASAPVVAAPAGNVVAAPAAASGKWTDTLNPDLKEYVSNKGFQDPSAVLESYRNFEKLQGVPRDRILKLPETADEQSWNEVYTKLGKPSTPDGYDIKPKEGHDSAFSDWAKSTFHSANLSTEQAGQIMSKLQEFTSGQETAEKAAHTEAVQSQNKALQKEWGSAYNQNIARAQAAYRTFGLPDNAVSALEKAIGFDGVMKFMHGLGAKLGEHSFVSGDGPNTFGEGAILTPVEAKSKIEALKQDADFRSRYLKGDVKAAAQLTRLHQMASASD